MKLRALTLPVVICVLTLSGTQSFAQSVERSSQPNPNSIEAVANEINLLRTSLQTLNTRLREISEKLSSSEARPGAAASEKQNRVAPNLELLARAEERVGILRKQLIELIEKDTSYKTRLAQMDEEARPENIERSMSGIGTTRTAEIRDMRRRSLEIEKRGLESLLNLTNQSRIRLEDDLKQAEALVSRIRQRLFPFIDRELEKMNPN